MTKLKIVNRRWDFEKIGVNEVEGLSEVLKNLMTPVQVALKENSYWCDLKLEDAPYKSCDGFIAHRHNCGGPQLNVQVPKCEEYNFEFLEFGECEDEECILDHQVGPCSYEEEGHLDAYMTIWLKFEGINQDNEMSFYLVLSGGNEDAPYFRNIPTLFETEFKAKTLSQLKKIGPKHIKKMIDFMGL